MEKGLDLAREEEGGTGDNVSLRSYFLQLPLSLWPQSLFNPGHRWCLINTEHPSVTIQIKTKQNFTSAVPG